MKLKQISIFSATLPTERIKILFLLGLFFCIATSCDKEFLEKKPDKALLIPVTLNDFQYLLDNQMFNQFPSLNQVASDDLQNNGTLNDLPAPYERTTYIWQSDMYGGPFAILDWEGPYKQIFHTNVVLDGLAKFKALPGQEERYGNVRGSALFLRASALYQLAQNFTKPYNPATAANDSGIPMPLVSDVNKRPGRGTLNQVYERIIMDLEGSLPLLPPLSLYKTRPSRHAALGLLARIYLSMQRYDKAEFYATACLALKASLIDYNTLNSSAANPIPQALTDKNPEGIFYAQLYALTYFNSALTTVDPLLYQSYTNNDLRKSLYFSKKANGLINFRGSYNGDRYLFGGLATDEIYLIRAECLARAGKANEALAVLNSLLIKRWKSGTFVPLAASNPDETLKLVLAERRKELVCRGQRWSDLRRLNMDPKFAITLTRVHKGATYTLEPNSPRYVLPIPENEIQGSGIEQNVR
ncbi:MAG: RagB/SusD family nutrient uptake outer membrane protein [Daejeonella sp.]